jgi:hypothetical protein
MKKSEVIKYLRNVREILKKAGTKDGYYVNLKHVREAFGTLYLGILKAIDEVLLRSGIEEEDIPQNVKGYRKYILKYRGRYSRVIDFFNDLHKVFLKRFLAT